MTEFPEISDVLFKKSNKFTAVNIETGLTKFFLFSEFYKNSAEVLFDKIQKSCYEKHFLIAPAIYLCHHFIELRLKELISGINYTKKEKYQFPDGHNLEILWNEYNSVIFNVDSSIIPDVADFFSLTVSNK